MIKLTFLHHEPESRERFEDHYFSKHVEVAKPLKGVNKVQTGRLVGTLDGTDAPYFRVADVYFDSMEAMEEMFATPEGQAAAADLAELSTGGWITFITELDPEDTWAEVGSLAR